MIQRTMRLAAHAQCVVAEFAKYCAICNDSTITNCGTDLQSSQLPKKKNGRRENKTRQTSNDVMGPLRFFALPRIHFI
jgi:hypothetical protein